MERKSLPVVGRSQSYLVLVGVVVGMMVAGLAVPLVFGESVGSGGDQSASTAFELPAGDLTAEDSLPLSTGSDPALAADGDPLASGTTGVASAGGPVGSNGGGSPAAPGSPGSTAIGTPSGPGSGTSSASGSTAPGGGASGPLTASDRGVSPTTIKIGATALDVATVGRLGVGVAVDPEQQVAAFKAFADEINSRGGINGRKIEVHGRPYDVTNRNDQIAACRELTQEKKVFAVLGGFNTVDPNVCVVEENKTPLISSANNNPDWVFARAGGNLTTLYPRSGRMMAALVSELERVKLAGKRIGILSDGLNDPGAKVAASLEQLLKARGHTVTYRGQLSDDISTASSQAPVEVNRMRTTNGGAEVVVFLSSNAVYGTQFVQQASRQNYRPQYVNSDWASNNGDTTNQNMPESYEGAIAFTFSRTMSSKKGLPPGPEANRCAAIYKKFSGRSLKAPGNAEYGTTVTICELVYLFEKMATRAGTNLTRPALNAARNQLGAFVAANMSDGSFGPQKPDMADLVRTQRWTFDCKCWNPVDAFHRPGG